LRPARWPDLHSGGKVRWRQPLAHGPVAGPVLATSDGDLLVICQSGVVALLDATSGQELARQDVGAPLGGAACLLGSQVIVAGSDGVVHRMSLPVRP
jgi:outer membrane protein assembly factor BamB